MSLAIGLALGLLLERPVSTSSGGCSASRSRRRRSARSSRSSPTRACFRPRSGARCSGRASPASSGRSSSSRSSSRASTAPRPEIVLLLGFGVLVAGAAAVATRARPPRLLRILQDTLHTTGQVGVRASIFVLALLVFLAADAGFEFVLGAFAGRSPRRARARLAGRKDRARAARGDRVRVPRPRLLRRHGDDLRPRQPAHGERPCARRAVPRPAARPRGASALLWLRELGARRPRASRSSGDRDSR